MPVVESLKKKSAFKQVYSRGRYAADSLLVVYALANNAGVNKLGLSVSKKVGNAVIRNRVRRLIKENYRHMHMTTDNSTHYDLVVVARASSGQLDKNLAFHKINDSLTRLFRKLGL